MEAIHATRTAALAGAVAAAMLAGCGAPASEVDPAASTGPGYLPQFKPPLHGFDEFRGFVSGNVDYQSHVDRMGRADWWNGETLEAEDGYLTDLIGDHAERFIAEHRDEPFFLYLAHHAPHYPYQGPGDPAERYAGDDQFPGVGSVTDRQRAYREMVESMDDGVGRVLDMAGGASHPDLPFDGIDAASAG